MPWRGPAEPGEFPTLGYLVGQWIEAHAVVPDGYLRGQPYRLTDEMWRFLLHFYRLTPTAEPWPSPDGLQYTGGQLRRSQKWGKDPFGAAIILAEALGPTRFDGWDAQGEAVGAPYPTPVIQCLGTSEEQTKNTFDPLLAMIRLGPLMDSVAWQRIDDVGETRIKLPNGGKIEPVTHSSKARLGQRLTFLTLTESHLFTLQGGHRVVAATVKRNAAGMDGRWLELTNAYDPTEGSEAQVTTEAADARVYVDNIPSNRVPDLRDRATVLEELQRQYADSARSRGGWVNLERIADEVQSGRFTEADRRRFFLNEIVVGQNVFVDPVHWDRMSTKDDPLSAGEAITIGFDGSRTRDNTVLVGCRIRDGRLFLLKIWQRPAHGADDWQVPTSEVDTEVVRIFEQYHVHYMFADPFLWQDSLAKWAAKWPKRVVEFPTNGEHRMDGAITRFITAFGKDEISHDGNETLTHHVRNTVIVHGSRKKPRPGEEAGPDTYYLKLAKNGAGKIDAAVASVLAYEARGHAIENGALEEVPRPKPSVLWI